MVDKHKDFAKAIVQPFNSTATTITMQTTGDADRFPDQFPFWVTIYDDSFASPADDPDRERIRVTARTSDAFTVVVRGQLGTPASNHNTAGRIYVAIAGPNAFEGTKVHNVRMFGAVGDGVADDTTAIQAAVDAAVADGGGVVFFPWTPNHWRLSTSAISVTGPFTGRLEFVGESLAEVRQTTTGVTAFEVGNNTANVHFRGLKIVGPQSALRNDAESAIRFLGTAANPIEDVSVVGCDIRTWGGNGVWFEFCNEWRVEGCRIDDIQARGIRAFTAAVNGVIKGNEISNVVGNIAEATAAIAIDRNETGTEATFPRARDITVANNTIRTITGANSAGIYAASAVRLTVIGNTLFDVVRGIELRSTSDGLGQDQYACLEFAILGNVGDSNVTNGSRSNFIRVEGARVVPTSVNQYATGSIVGNCGRGFGDETLDTAADSGAIALGGTRGLVVSGNYLIEPSAKGIYWFAENRDFVCIGNSITDPWSDTLSAANAIDVRSNENHGTISGNTGGLGTKTATQVLDNMVFVSTTGPPQVVKYGPNPAPSATSELNDGDDDSLFDLASLAKLRRTVELVEQIRYPIRKVTAAATLNAEDLYVGTDTTVAAFTLTLAATPLTGSRIYVKDETGQWGTNNLTIAGNGNNIDGAASIVLSTNFQAVVLLFDGTAWFRIE